MLLVLTRLVSVSLASSAGAGRDRTGADARREDDLADDFAIRTGQASSPPPRSRKFEIGSSADIRPVLILLLPWLLPRPRFEVDEVVDAEGCDVSQSPSLSAAAAAAAVSCLLRALPIVAAEGESPPEMGLVRSLRRGCCIAAAAAFGGGTLDFTP